MAKTGDGLPRAVASAEDGAQEPKRAPGGVPRESDRPDASARQESLRVGVLIPTYNHCGTLLQVMQGVRKHLADVLVVNDGSTDETRALLEEHAEALGVQVLHLPKNQGKGGALLAGLRHAATQGWDVAISIDSDGQHDPDDLPTFLAQLAKEPDALIVGSRHFGQNTNITWKSRFGRAFSNFWLRVIAGRPLPDSQSGFRAYPVEAVLSLGCRSGRYEFEVEVLVRAAWAGIPLVAVPIQVYYPPREERITHFRTIRDFLRISLLNTFLFFRLLAPIPKKKVQSKHAPAPKLGWHARAKQFWIGEVASSLQTNRELAVAVGFGVFMGIVPIWGYQMLVAAYLAHMFRLNKLVVLAASNVSFGPMVVVITLASLWLGHFFLTGQVHGAWVGDFSTWEAVWAFAQARFWSWLLGSMILATTAGFLGGVLAYVALQLFRKPAGHPQTEEQGSAVATASLPEDEQVDSSGQEAQAASSGQEAQASSASEDSPETAS